MAEPFRILFVCVGNVCRSPMAERLTLRRLEQHGAGDAFSVASAGTRGMVGHSMTQESAAELGRRDVSGDGHIARRLDESLVRDANLVLTATVEERRVALEQAPMALRRTFTWREFAALVDGHVAGSAAELVAKAAVNRADVGGLVLDTEDPIGKSTEVYARVAAEIDDAITAIASALAACEAP